MNQRYAIAQEKYTVLEDDDYNFSVMTPAEMTLTFDTLRLDERVFYVVYAGSYINEKDTLYYRIDVWENPFEVSDSTIHHANVMLDSTLTSVQERLRGTELYSESFARNTWPGRLVRYDLETKNRQAKILLVRRLNRYYLLTVISSPTSLLNKSVNRFLHSFKLYE